jgi:hypothetical protein
MMHPLDALTWLSKVDKHRQLSVVLTGLDKARSRLVRGSAQFVDAEQVRLQCGLHVESFQCGVEPGSG